LPEAVPNIGPLPAAYGKYELLEKIGAGGMAEVYRARLPGVAGFEKICVIKRILPHLAQQAQIGEMFIEEAKLAARVQHRNVVQVYDLGALENGELYIAMEYVAGTDLSVLLRNSVKRKLRIPMWFSVHVISEVLAGLSCVHEMVDDMGKPLHVVHRDVTPSNLFISYVGDIKLGDFGVAQSSLKAQQTRVGELKGKVAYMSPEQLYGRQIDGRADVFAAGVVLWECLTQRRLFGGRPEIETMNAICAGPRMPPSKYDPAIPAELDQIVLRALESDADNRIPSAAEFQAALAGVLPKFANRVLQADVRHVVEVLLGQVSPDSSPQALGGPTREAREAQTRARTGSVTSKSFLEQTPGIHGRKYQLPPGAKSDPPPSPSPESYVPKVVEYRRPAGSLPEAEVDPQVPKFNTGDIEMVVEFGAEAPEPEPDLIEVDLENFLAGTPDPRDMARAVASADTDHGSISDTPPWATLSGQPSPKPNADGTPIKRDGGYRGPHPFWLQSEAQMIWGPCDYHVIKSYLANGADRGNHTFRIAAYQTPWVDLEIFATLSGQEMIRPSPPMPKKGFFNGSLRLRSLPSVLGSLAAARSSGRLVIEGEDPQRPPRREIHLKDGVPIYIATDSPKLQLPDILLRRGMLTPEITPKVMHEVLYRLEPIEVVAARHVEVDVEKNYALIMRERAAEMFYWRSGVYAFDHEFAPTRGQAITRSLLQLVAYAVARSKSEQELKEAVAPWVGLRLTPTDRLTQGLKDLQLNDEQSAVAKALWQGTPLGAMLKKATADQQRVYSLVAYVMVETGLVAPVTS